MWSQNRPSHKLIKKCHSHLRTQLNNVHSFIFINVAVNMRVGQKKQSM